MKSNLAKALFTLMMLTASTINSFTASVQEDMKIKKDGAKMNGYGRNEELANGLKW